MIKSVGVVVAVCAVPLVGISTPAHAVATYTVSMYNMNEPTGSTVLVDNSGNGLNGAIGPNAVAGVVFDGATAHRFLDRSPTMPPAEPERLDTVPHTTMQNPDAQDYSITVRYRTNKPFGNLVQKGQNGTVGGYFKIELPAGRPTCLFKGVGPGGVVQQRAIEAPLNMGFELNDNEWHTITCERLQNRIALYIDGPEAKRLVGPTGTIANNKNLSIAGKSVCDQIEITCDYFVGDIDWIRIDKGTTGPVPNVPPTAAFTNSCAYLGCAFDGSSSSDPNNSIKSYAWNFGDGATSTGVTSAHTYATPGTYTVRLTVTDTSNATGTITHDVTVAPNAPPTAAFSTSCAGLGCSFNGSASSDPEGQIASYAWDFGDGGTGTGVTATHSFAAAGDYTVGLTVTDGVGAINTTTQIVSVAPLAETISFVGQASASTQSINHAANVPAAVMPGDGLLLFFSSGTNATVGEPTGVPGWVPVDSLAGINGSTRVWRKVAAPGDAGAQVGIAVSTSSKGNLAIVAYHGTSTIDPVAGFARQLLTNDSAARTTPVADVGAPTWAVSYWMHRDSSTTALTPPGGVAVRATGTQSGGGRVTTLVADSGASVPVGTYGGLTATAAAASSLATTWTIILAPA